MHGVTIIETAALEALIASVQNLQETVTVALAEVKDTQKPYLSVNEVMELTGFGKSWVNENKAKIGFSSIGGCLRFKRSDVAEFMEANYFKVDQKRRKAS
ncbi:MAG: DNA-binding protein [Pedobacter sp.]|nr:MAG: DNA-binding protein [Pedobacter sp.]